jgi:hypothetical protein
VIAGLVEPVEPRRERAAAFVLIAGVAHQRLVAGRQRAALGPRPDMVAGRIHHRVPAIGTGLADRRDKLGAGNRSHDGELSRNGLPALGLDLKAGVDQPLNADLGRGLRIRDRHRKVVAVEQVGQHVLRSELVFMLARAPSLNLGQVVLSPDR